MANNISLITKYLPEVVDKVFATESKSAILNNGAKWTDLNFKQAGYIRIASILMDGLSDYHRVNSGEGNLNGTHYNSTTRRDGFEKGNADLSWEIFALRYDRGKQFQIDAMDDEETAGLMIGNLLSEFIRTRVVPEVDISVFSTLASKCSASYGNLLVDKTITANKIIEDFNNAFVWLADAEVPEEDQVIFVSPKVWGLILNTTELNKFITQGDMNSNITNSPKQYMGREIIVVPASRFYTDVVFGDNGYYASASSKVINYIICSKKAVVPVKKLEYNKIWTPEQVQDFNGYKVNFRIYHDCIVPKNKVAGVYCSVSAVKGEEKANRLFLNIKEDDGTHFTITEAYTTPAGLRGTIAHQTGEMKVGTKYNSASKVEVGVSFDRGTSKEYFALLDEDNKAVAVSKQITLGA